jgi:hypothetical protein
MYTSDALNWRFSKMTVYRHVIVPAIRGGASVMDAVFGDEDNGDGQPGTAAVS